MACAGLLAAAAAAPVGRTPPRVGGPLTQQDVPSCLIAGPAQACRFDYTLDPASTNDPTDRWYAFWGSAFLTDRIPSGYCTTEVGTLLEWQRAAAGALPTATYPRRGTSKVGPGDTARLVVDAAGHATTPAVLQQKAAWPAGTVTATPGRGHVAVIWEGRTTQRVAPVVAAEVSTQATIERDPAFAAPAQSVASVVRAPCSALPPPGAGFLARVVPATVSRGRPAWLQVRIPGTQLKCVPGKIAGGGTTEPGCGPNGAGRARVTFSGSMTFDAGTSPGAIGTITIPGFPFTFRPVIGVSAVTLRPTGPGVYPVHVTLTGPTGSRSYSLSLHVR